MKKPSWLKKLIASLLSLTMLLGVMPLTVFATDVKTLDEINRENAAEYAISFVDVVYENPGLESGDVISFYDENDVLSGYCVDILDDGQPNGYVVIKFLDGEQTVSEFAIEPGIENPYDQIAEDENISLEDVTYYSVGPTDYQIVDTDSNAVYSFENAESTMNQFQELKQETQLNAAISDENEIDLNSTNGDFLSYISNSYSGAVESRGSLPGAGSVSYCYQNVIERTLNKTYGCTIVAMCNMMKYYYSRGYTNIHGDLAALYDALWSYSLTSSGGSTFFPSAPGAIKNYLNSRGYSCSYDVYWLSLYSDFTRDISNGKPALMCYNFNPLDGHTVFVVGFVDTTTANYLSVIDGIHSTTRYFNYDAGGVSHLGFSVQM